MKFTRTRAGRPTAFTLIELLAVVAIIAVLAALALGVAKYVGNRANYSQTRALLARLDLALENFRIDNGYYPTSTIYRSSSPLFHAEVMNSALLYAQLTSPKKYVSFSGTEIAVTIPELSAGGSTYIVDAWGVPIVYYRPVDNDTNFVSSMLLTNYGYGTVPSANFYIADWDNFSIGGLVNTVGYDLFSYGPDKATYVPGSKSLPGGYQYSARGWARAFTNSNSMIDDVSRSQR